jgi:hypothetical protein
MPELTRRLIDAQHESWGIYYDRVRVGGISRRAGSPRDAPGWQWFCGFFCDNAKPGEDRNGVAASFDEAREAFEIAWREYLPKRSPEDFAEVRHRDAWTAEKYARGQNSAPPWPLTWLDRRRWLDGTDPNSDNRALFCGAGGVLVEAFPRAYRIARRPKNRNAIRRSRAHPGAPGNRTVYDQMADRSRRASEGCRSAGKRPVD